MAALGTTLMLAAGFLTITGRLLAAVLFIAGLCLLIFDSVAIGLMAIGASVVAPFFIAGICGIISALGSVMVERGIEKHGPL
jgi:hypothetical protein